MNSTYLSLQHQYDDIEPDIDFEAEAKQSALESFGEREDVKNGDLVRNEAREFLSDPKYTGPLAGMFDLRDCLLEAECWIDRSKVFARDEWLAHDKDGIITRMEGGHQEAKVHMADLHAFLTAAILAGNNRTSAWNRDDLRGLIAHVAIESIAQAIEGDDERLMMLMEAGL